ncbi:MAG: EI24 domain-containing protein [Pseudomonadota bacterium]
MDVGLIADSFLRALGQISDPRFRRVLFLGIVLAFLLLIGFTAGFMWVTDWLVPEQLWLPIIGEVYWVDDFLSWSALFLVLFLSTFLMVPVASAITSLFFDDVAAAVEARHYPQLPRGQGVSFGDGLVDTINFLGVLLAANLLALIIAGIMLVFFPPGVPFVFYTVNGLLLGREYFTMVAIRRVGRKEAKVLRRKFRGTIWLAGFLMALPLSVPLLNLVIPILGAATFTHLYHGLTTRRPETSVPHHPR